MKTVNDLLEQAISETLNLNNNEVFLLKKIFLRGMNGTEYHAATDCY